MGKFKMRVLYVLLSLLLSGAAAQAKEKATRNVVVTAEEEKVRDSAGYAAIAEIHREMDDDQSGSIDRKETSGFMAEDMHMRSSDRLRRENAFHGNDEAITVDDLWEAWFESEERAWTNEQVLNWVVNVVNLPIYADRIAKLKIDGSILPRLAAHNSSFMSQQLGIKSSVHRQKLRLNALDVVLFGYRDPTNKTKDIALGLLLLLLTSLLIVYARQRKRAVQQVNELNNRLSELKNMETEFEDVQKKWNDERSKVSTADGGVSATQIENLKIQLEEAERRLEQNGACNGTPLALQPLLRKTCEHELAYMEKQRQDCLREMKEAIELVDRLQKKQGSVLSSLKLATGASSASDQVDSKIFALRSRMEKIHALTRDTQERWMQIESLCGFPILYLSETGLTHSSSAQHFYGSRSGSSSVSSHSNGGIPHSASALAGLHQTPSVARPTVQPSAAAVPSPAFPNGTGSAVAAEHRTPPIRMVPTSHGENASLFSDDTESVMSTEKKKRRGIFKMFKKSNSKGSLQNSSFASNASAAS